MPLPPEVRGPPSSSALEGVHELLEGLVQSWVLEQVNELLEIQVQKPVKAPATVGDVEEARRCFCCTSAILLALWKK